MKLSILIDNTVCFGTGLLKGEHGFSALIETEGIKVLFDAGYSGLVVSNSHVMGIDLNTIDCLVFSHGHWDHTGGLKSILENRESYGVKTPIVVYAHPEAFYRKRNKGKDIGSPMIEEEIAKRCDLRLTRDPVWFTERLVFLGEIPRKNDFEIEPLGQVLKNGMWIDDFVLDDSGIVYNSDDGLVVIGGCSHSGICNIITHAIKVFGTDKIAAVIGGFHLQGQKLQTERTVNVFQEANVEKMYPCHCTDLNAKFKLNEIGQVCDIGVGFTYSWDE